MSQQAFMMDKTYNPQEIEQKTYAAWEASGAFIARRDPDKKPYCIVMPPPNITGQLHMGHAWDTTMQDILIRYHRMLGDATLWLPGTDHASIATEARIVEQLGKEGTSKKELGRERFLERAWRWKEKYGGHITRQLRRMGASCDWSRERFTLDEGCSRAVREVFVRLYEKALIYQGERIINWCPVCRTALSDIEVEYDEKLAHLYFIRYPAEDGGEGLVVATTRPETMLGDTGVAVNPEDSRYTHLVGRRLRLPLTGRLIPVVSDSYVEMAFGTGAVKMTPAHDPNDFDVAQRQGLEILRVMNDDGTMNMAAGADYAGLTGLDAREKVLKNLADQGLLVKVQDYTHNVGACCRCGTGVEPLISKQWFVRMQPLAEPAINAVRDGDTRFIPERFAKTYFNWMENIKDWCISRQLWWGHRIPVWYCQSCGKIIVASDTPDTCPDCGSSRLLQDEDVLDTWFSSALWPFSTLGWPEKTPDLDYFYPTSALVTGYDIIFFWVARMIFSGIEFMGETPFSQVLIHGLLRDGQGRKMSKSLGNGIDPLELVDDYGADALRFSLVFGVSPGADSRFSREKTEAARNFANKVWNAARFVLMNLEGPEPLNLEGLSAADKWILSRTNKAISKVSQQIEGGDLMLAAQSLYDFAWDEFCDWYIELSKGDLFGGEARRQAQVRGVLSHVLSTLLRLLHPFMPYLTETVYAFLPGFQGESCMLAPWPEVSDEFGFTEAEAQMNGVMDMIRAIRALRQEMKVQPGQRANLYIKAAEGWAAPVAAAAHYLQRLAGAKEVVLIPQDKQLDEKTVSAVCPVGEILIPLGELVDIGKEVARLEKEAATLQAEINRGEGKLKNPGFAAKAPEHLVQQERDKIVINTEMLKSIARRIEELKA
ncbi:MAG: valine--tRNA ligase [Eubacteriales bacterium]|jgi:valyl-tRNA synthetase|nr:valine--tRNA ligase [Eubacteriales bacterium]